MTFFAVPRALSRIHRTLKPALAINAPVFLPLQARWYPHIEINQRKEVFMNNPNYYNLFAKYKEHIASVRNVNMNGSVIYEQVCCVYNRAAQLTLLDLFLEKYRNANKSAFNDLPGKKALYHLLFSRYKWTPEQIRKLSLDDVLLILHDDLRIENFDPTVSKYFEQTLRNYDQIHFPEIKDEEWELEDLSD